MLNVPDCYIILTVVKSLHCTTFLLAGGDDRRCLHGRVGSTRTQWHPTRAGDSKDGSSSVECCTLVQNTTPTKLPTKVADRHTLGSVVNNVCTVSLSLSLCLSRFLFLALFPHHYIRLSLSLSLPRSLYFSLSLLVSHSIPLSLSLSLSTFLSLWCSIYMCISLSLSLSLSLCLSSLFFSLALAPHPPPSFSVCLFLSLYPSSLAFSHVEEIHHLRNINS